MTTSTTGMGTAAASNSMRMRIKMRHATRCRLTRTFPVTEGPHGMPSDWFQVIVPKGSADLCAGCVVELTKFLTGEPLVGEQSPPQKVEAAR